jgi:hypothetical protein
MKHNPFAPWRRHAFRFQGESMSTHDEPSAPHLWCGVGTGIESTQFLDENTQVEK